VSNNYSIVMVASTNYQFLALLQYNFMHVPSSNYKSLLAFRRRDEHIGITDAWSHIKDARGERTNKSTVRRLKVYTERRINNALTR